MTDRIPRRELVAARFKPLIERLPARDPVEGVQPLNPGFFTLERIRLEAQPKDKDETRSVLRSIGK